MDWNDCNYQTRFYLPCAGDRADLEAAAVRRFLMSRRCSRTFAESSGTAELSSSGDLRFPPYSRGDSPDSQADASGSSVTSLRLPSFAPLQQQQRRFVKAQC